MGLALFYQDRMVTIYLGDCRDFDYHTGLFSCVVTDPPFGISYISSRRGANDGVAEAIHGDSYFDPLLMRTVASMSYDAMPYGSAMYWFCREDIYHDLAEEVGSCGWITRRALFWDKTVWGMGNLEEDYAPTVEMVAFFTKGRHNLNGGRSTNLLRFPRVSPGDLLHSCQKPEPLLSFLIGKSTVPGETVFDPFCGSGSTLAAAKRIGRRAIGIDISEKNCAISARRLQQMSLPLWDSDGTSKADTE